MRLRVRMHRDMRLIEMRDDGVLLLARCRQTIVVAFRDQHRHRRALRLVILTCDIEDIGADDAGHRSEEHTSELQSLMRISYAVFCLKKNNKLMTADQHNKNTQD